MFSWGPSRIKIVGGGTQVTTDKYTVYVHIRMNTGAAAVFWFEKGTSEKNSYMNSSQVLYCNGVAKISVRGDIQHECTRQRHMKNI